MLAHIPETGSCAARKMNAVARSVEDRLNRRPEASRIDALCRAFDRAGDCAGDCIVVDTELTKCLEADGPRRDLPALAPDDQVILFGAYEGDAISSTTVAGQDKDTVTARVVIEPGATPLYVLLASYEEMIWRFEGDVPRVHHVVLLGRDPHGVTGIASERVADVPALSGYFYSTDSLEARAMRNAVELSLGRPVDVLAGSYSVGTLALPSATVAPSIAPSTVPPGFDPGVYESLGLLFNPGGVVDIDPSLVVSAAPAERYDVLPQGFGLAQLVATGALEYWGGHLVDSYFYVERPIPRFPAGLFGAHAVVFVLGTGVPMPSGNPGHSCVISEETGLPITDTPICGLSAPPMGSDLLQ